MAKKQVSVKATAKFDVDQVMQIIQDELQEAAQKISLEFVTNIKLVLNRGGGGTGKNRVHSPPGSPPFKQTGTLGRSWAYIKPNQGKPGKEIKTTVGQKRIGNVLKYAMALQWGYRPNNLLPRPYLQPAMKAVSGTNPIKKGQYKLRAIITTNSKAYKHIKNHMAIASKKANQLYKGSK
tara:strand:+ start:1613 stop:2149 length:537 start_codon:yes stop_codon:yes gene_type:complete